MVTTRSIAKGRKALKGSKLVGSTFRETLDLLEASRRPPRKPKKVKKKETQKEREARYIASAKARAARIMAVRYVPGKKSKTPAQVEQQAATKAASREKYHLTELIQSRVGKEIGLVLENGQSIFAGINWERRKACRNDLKLYCESYLQATFNLSWSDDQLTCVRKAQIVVLEGGKFALAMPRGGGKTAICRGATNWATDYAHKRHIFNIGSTEVKAEETVEYVKVQHYNNPLLFMDFPELCWSIRRLENANRLAAAQTFLGKQTHAHWGSDYVRFPTLLLPKELLAPAGTDAIPGEPLFEWYLRHDPKSLCYLPHLDCYAPTSAGNLLKRAGIDGAVRGEAPTNPVTLEILRPDMVLLDDVQKDHKADSPVMTEKLIRLIEGAVTGLAGPTSHIDVLMPCTVIREGDAADVFLNPLLKPEYQGERCKLVKAWPPGITDHEITYDSEEGKLWNEYAELRRTGLRDKGNFKEATALYKLNQKEMDNGFLCTWSERYDRRSEISPQQFAMNLRLELGPMFLPEYQNIGRQLIATGDIMITADQLSKRTLETKQGFLAPDYQIIVTHLDIQDEIMFWATFACDLDFNGTFIDYGTWPEMRVPYFTKDQANSWGLVTKGYFDAHPEHKAKATRTKAGRIRAPLDMKIYWGLSKVVPLLLNKEYTRSDITQRKMKTQMLSIDTRWGQASDAIKRYIRESGIQNIIPYYGQAFPPTNKQLEEYEQRDGWLFEHQRNPLVKEPKWVVRPNPDGMWYMAADVNRLKDFLFTRLSVPIGAGSAIGLFNAPAERHEMFSHHICSSEYPEPNAARGIVKNLWIQREGTAFDNDWLDCAAGCMAVASERGATVKTSGFEIKPIHRKLSELRDQKRGHRSKASH